MPSQRRQGAETHAAAKMQGQLMCEKPQKHPRTVTQELGLIPSKKVVGSTAQVKCIYTSARSMGNKQEELEVTVQQENCDIVAITEARWDGSHGWSAAMDGCHLFGRDRQGRRR